MPIPLYCDEGPMRPPWECPMKWKSISCSHPTPMRAFIKLATERPTSGGVSEGGVVRSAGISVPVDYDDLFASGRFK
jgi:hypothetical protein